MAVELLGRLRLRAVSSAVVGFLAAQDLDLAVHNPVAASDLAALAGTHRNSDRHQRYPGLLNEWQQGAENDNDTLD